MNVGPAEVKCAVLKFRRMNDNNIINILNGIIKQSLSIPGGDVLPEKISYPENPELEELFNGVIKLLSVQSKAVQIIESFANGDFNTELPINDPIFAPLKSLQSKFKHLNWQTKRIAEGDYSQKIDFMGDFSNSYNHLIESLKERKEIEQELYNSKKRYELIAENTQDVIFGIDLETLRFKYISPSILKQRGLTVEEGMAQTLKEALTPKYYDIAITRIKDALDSIRNNTYTPSSYDIYEQTCKDGSTIEVEISTNIVFDQTGNPIELIGISRDITERRKAEQELIQSEEKYRLITENANDVICKLDLKMLTITYVSPSVKNVLGYGQEEVIGKNIYTFLPVEESSQLKQFEARLQSDAPSDKKHIRIDIFKKTGKTIKCELSATLLYKKEQGTYEAVGVLRDISRRVKIEKALKESQQQLKSLLKMQTKRNQVLSIKFQYLFNNTNQGISFFVLSGKSFRFVSCNRAWAKYLDSTPDKIEGNLIEEVCDQETAEIYRFILNKALQNKTSLQEYVAWKSYYFHVIVNPIKNLVTNKIDSFATFIYNITEKQEAQKQAFDGNERFFQIFNYSNDGIVLLDSEYNPLEINKGFYSIYGTNNVQITSNLIDQFISPNFKESVLQQFKNLEFGKNIPSFECEIIDVKGKHKAVEFNISLLNLYSNIMVLCIIRDISSRKELERTLNNISIQIANRERKSIANDLHDNVGPLLSSMNMYLSILTRKTDVHPHLDIITNTQSILKETIASVREISNNLNPQVLQRFGLSAALNAFFETKKTLIKIDIDNQIGDLRFSEDKEAMVYNIIKELFNNSLKHAQAQKITLAIQQENQHIFIDYTDDGIGFNLEEKILEANNKLGLISIINRVNNIEGKHKILTSHGDGFKFKLNFPITRLE